MKIVVDANIMIAALLGSQQTIRILARDEHEFCAPAIIIDEIKKYKIEISAKSGMSSSEFDSTLDALLVLVHKMDYEEYQDHVVYAARKLAKRDVKDADYLACAMVSHADFIWTNDKDFTAQRIVPTKTTRQFTDSFGF